MALKLYRYIDLYYKCCSKCGINGQMIDYGSHFPSVLTGLVLVLVLVPVLAEKSTINTNTLIQQYSLEIECA